MVNEARSHLLALVYEAGGGPAADALLVAAAGTLERRGVVLAGTVQQPANAATPHPCNLIGHDLGSGARLRLSAERGGEARGCLLDTAVLEDLAGMAARSLEAGADALIVSRFGKREEQGAGFRAAVASAVTRGIPALVTVSREHLPGWRAFADGIGAEAPATAEAARSWAMRVVQSLAARTAA